MINAVSVFRKDSISMENSVKHLDQRARRPTQVIKVNKTKLVSSIQSYIR